MSPVCSIPLRLLNISAGTEVQFCESDAQSLRYDIPAIHNYRHSAHLTADMISDEIQASILHFEVENSQ